MVDADAVASACVLAVCDSLDQPPAMDVPRLRLLLAQLAQRRSSTAS
jgi:hypothetical protein